MPRRDRVDVSRVVDEQEVRRWVTVHQQECDAFQRYLRRVDPRSWREEFVRIVADTIEASDRN